MARPSVSLFLFAAASVALFGSIKGFSVPPTLTISTPDEYAQFRAGASSGYAIYVIEATAHPNTFGEVRAVARSNPVPSAQRIVFQDMADNYIAIEPSKKEVDADLFHRGSNYFRYLPTDYKSYQLHTYTTTDVNLDAVEQWPATATIVLGNAWEPSGAILERFQRIQKTHGNLRLKDIHNTAPLATDMDSPY